MPRYTDIDKLIAEYDRVHIGPAGGARKLMVEAPIADVVPRAMIAEIFGEIEELAKIYTFPVVKNGVAEIVKEPFWCIEPSDLAELKKKYTEGENKQKDFFSPEEVRAMSRKEVRENYTAIMNSMKKWHTEGE